MTEGEVGALDLALHLQHPVGGARGGPVQPARLPDRMNWSGNHKEDGNNENLHVRHW
jgi:hypothetical protein